MTKNFKQFVTEATGEKAMKEQLEKSFKKLDDKIIKADQEWAEKKLDTLKDFLKTAEEGFKNNEYPYNNMSSGYGRFDTSMATIHHYGSKAMMNLLHGRGKSAALANMKKNTLTLIEKRNAQIIKALGKKGIKEIPPFELKEVSDGFEGYFEIGNNTVHIRTIVAGGYNIQRIHQRTLVKVK